MSTTRRMRARVAFGLRNWRTSGKDLDSSSPFTSASHFLSAPHILWARCPKERLQEEVGNINMIVNSVAILYHRSCENLVKFKIISYYFPGELHSTFSTYVSSNWHLRRKSGLLCNWARSGWVTVFMAKYPDFWLAFRWAASWLIQVASIQISPHQLAPIRNQLG